MDFKVITRCIIWGVVWAIIFIILGFIIVKFSDFNLKDVLFIEGIVLVILGASSCIGGNPLGLSIQAMAQSNAQYAANANLEITRMEKEKNNRTSNLSLRSAFNLVSLVFAGIICIIINYLI